VGRLLADRGQQVLKSLVECYISEGQPVGSRLLSRCSSLSLSAASIRNVMADLEAMGYIHSPHTSAGRVPTVRGYRFFVDGLITMQPLDQSAVEHLQCSLSAQRSPKQLVDAASRMLSDLSMQAGLVTLPRQGIETLRQVDFLPLSSGQVLVVLVVNEKEVQNRVISLEREFSMAELKEVSNFINAHYAGCDLAQLREALLTDMQSDKDNLARLMQAAIDLAGEALGDGQAQDDYMLAGESHLLDMASRDDVDRLRDLFRAFEQKKDILGLMERCMAAEGVQVYIGEESGFGVLDDYSVVTTPYQISGSKVGVLGVIGPTRMAYERVIPLVDITARLLSAALDQS
jgi:heat-inducible transcriptional repressor